MYVTVSIRFHDRVGSDVSGGAILADAMGLGKTLSAIALVYCAMQHKLASKAVVVVSEGVRTSV